MKVPKPRQVLRSLVGAILLLIGLVYLFVVRTALWLFTLALVVYFAVNDPLLSSRILTQVNQVIPGDISARRLFWRPFRSQVDLLGVRIERPGGIPVIEAEHVSTHLRLVSLVASLVVPSRGSQPIPLIMDETRVSDGEVRLEFDEHGLGLVRAFVPEHPRKKKGGRSVHLILRSIEVRSVRVILMFHGKWGMDICNVSTDGAVEFAGGKVRVDASDVKAEKVVFTGSSLLPPMLSFLTDTITDFRTGSYLLDGDHMEVRHAAGSSDRLSFTTSGALNLGTPLTLNVAGGFKSLDPAVMSELSAGVIDGVVQGSASIQGALREAKLQTRVTSPTLSVLGVPFDDVDTRVDFSLDDPLLFRVRSLTAWQGAGRVKA